MDRYAALLEIAELLLSEEDSDGLAETIFRKLVEVTSAERGFIVVRGESGLEVKLDVRFEQAGVTADERRFSRGLVRDVVEARATFVSQDILGDARLARFESLEQIGARAVIVAPLEAGGQVYGVAYLDQTTAGRSFAADGVAFVTDFARLAGLFMRRALEQDELRARARSLETDLFAKHDFTGIVSRDPKMLALLKVVAQVAKTDAAVLVSGETGTGKELVAHAVHINSARARKPFVALHCAALPPSLLESELFGHVRGAFTGADRERMGRVSAAQGGTLFLDEVAEMPFDLQAKLLRFLQSGEIQRLGSDRVEKVDVRVVAASHRDLRAMVAAGTFRQDLYYRLRVVDLHLPALRQRTGDIPLLVDTFLREPRPGLRTGARFTAEALERLCAHDYPGNVRELLHIVERARVLATGEELGVELLPEDLFPGAAAIGEGGDASAKTLAAARERAVRAAERAFLNELLERCGGNISQAAREAGLPRSYLQRLLTKHGLRSA